MADSNLRAQDEANPAEDIRPSELVHRLNNPLSSVMANVAFAVENLEALHGSLAMGSDAVRPAERARALGVIDEVCAVLDDAFRSAAQVRQTLRDLGGSDVASDAEVVVPPSLGLQIYSNGFISQTAEDPTMTFAGTIPSASRPNGVIAPYWADLVTGTDGVCSVVVGTAPIRRWIIQWKNAQFYSGVEASPLAGSASFEIIYNESDRSMDFIYESISGQPTTAPTIAAVGVEHPNGVNAFVVCPGGRRGGVTPECTAVTTGTRFRLAPTGG